MAETAPAIVEPSAPAAWPLSTRAQIAAGMALSFANFMVLLDLTIVNVSIPHISGHLGISLDQGAWLITSYAVAEAICLPLTGWLTDRFGSVRVFVMCLTAFAICSLLCGVSLGINMLVVARIVQGFAGAPLIPIAQALTLRVFPPERRNMAMSIWAITVMVAPALGPVLGGWITDNFSWQWIFLINVPIAFVCILVGSVTLTAVETPTVRRPMDKVGIVLLVFWIGCLQMMLDIGRDHDWFADWRIVALGVAAAIGFFAFLIWELTEEHPVVDLRIFRHRTFAIGAIIISTTFAGYFSTVVVIPQWLQVTQGYTAQQAGILLACTAGTSIIMGIVTPRLLDRFDLRILVSLGCGWFAILCLIRTGWISGMEFWTMALPQVLQGGGLAVFMIAVTQMSLGSVRPEEVNAAAGLQNFIRTICVAIFTSLILTDWSNQQRVETNGMVDKLRPDETVRALGENGLGLDYARTLIAGIVNQQAVTVAMSHTFMVAAAVSILAAVIVWLSPRPKPLKQMQIEH